MQSLEGLCVSKVYSLYPQETEAECIMQYLMHLCHRQKNSLAKFQQIILGITAYLRMPMVLVGIEPTTCGS